MLKIKLWPIALLLMLSTATQAVPTARRAYDEAIARNPDIVKGAKLFERCAACHGRDGTGSPDRFIPAIAGQHWQVLTKQILDYRYFRRWDTRMAGAISSEHLHGPQDIADVVAYVNSLQPRSAASSGTGVGPGDRLGPGGDLYARRCASCHGNAAQGNGPEGYPRLAGQQYRFLVRQMQEAPSGRRPFSREHVKLLKKLDEADIRGVADHLSRIEP